MTLVLDSWHNKTGELVVLTYHGPRIVDPATGLPKSESKSTAAPVAHVEPEPQREMIVPGGGRVKVSIEPGDPGVVEIVNPKTDTGRAFAIPRPYFEQPDKK